MLIRKTPDRYEKLAILGGMATDDILYPTGGGANGGAGGRGGQGRGPYPSAKKNPSPGIYRAAMPNGKFISLMRVMFTDFCKMDCAYCPNSHWVPRKRYAFKVDELANVFAEAQQRGQVSGLFLSSGIAGSGSKTMERLLKVVDSVRNRHGFRGYIHLKVMPGAEAQYVEAAHRLGTRLSVNIETPTVEHMNKLSNMKDFDADILDPIRWIHDLTASRNGGPNGGAVGQATQLVVGAADETDRQIFARMDQLYTERKLKRIYYAPFRPVRHTPLEEHPPTPMIRSHRLYQIDWLKRVYGFSNDEIDLAFTDDGYAPLDEDPKTSIAVENLDAFPVDINSADHDRLLRIPGVGPKSAQRIVANRRRHSIDTWRDLKAMGVVHKRAWPFIAFPGHRPPRAKQLRLDLFGESAKEARRASATATTGALGGAAGPQTAPCGEARSCQGCPMFGAPGHPGPTDFAA